MKLQDPGLPPLDDLSPAGRVRFLDRHEDVLWSFWRAAFEEAFEAQPRFITHEHLPRLGRSPVAAAEHLAEKLIERLRRADIKLRRAPDWTDIRTWYNWLVSHRVARLVKANLDRVPAVPWHLPEWVVVLIDTWRKTVGRVRDRTGISTFEADWLYATVRARRPVAKRLRREGDDAPWSEEQARALLASDLGPRHDKVARSRRGAAAAFRFDVEHLASELPQFVRLREVYVGPVRSEEESVPLPSLPVGGQVVNEFLAFATVLHERINGSRGDRNIAEEDQVQAEVLAVGLNKASTRLLPPPFRERGEAAWPNKKSAEEAS